MSTTTYRFNAVKPSDAVTKPPETFRYGKMLVALHWFMAALLVAVFASIELRVLFAKGTEMRDFMKALHFTLGLSILLMVVLRLLARAKSPRPDDGGMRSWSHWAASLGHLALYVLMIGMPVLGWLALSASGKPIPFFGFELPALITPDKSLARTLKELHEALGTASYALIGIHVAAALGHHYGLKDGLMLRMSWTSKR